MPSALEDQVAKWIFGMRHARRLASVDSGFDDEPLRLAKLFQIAQHEKKPPRNLDDIYRECCCVKFYNQLICNMLNYFCKGRFGALASRMLKGM